MLHDSHVQLYTIGHSSRSAQELIELLEEHGVRLLVDVRRFPGSRLHPQFGREPLAASLAAAQILYRHAPELGGRRRARDDSVNTAWHNAGFRGYADYMASDEFKSGLQQLTAEAAETATAVMCAEAVPWQCHRNLLADALVAQQHEVVHILGRGQTQSHKLNSAAIVTADGRITYPASGQQNTLL